MIKSLKKDLNGSISQEKDEDQVAESEEVTCLTASKYLRPSNPPCLASHSVLDSNFSNKTTTFSTLSLLIRFTIDPAIKAVMTKMLAYKHTIYETTLFCNNAAMHLNASTTKVCSVPLDTDSSLFATYTPQVSIVLNSI